MAVAQAPNKKSSVPCQRNTSQHRKMIAYPSMRDDRTLQEEALKMASMRAEAKDAAMYTFESPITRRMSVIAQFPNISPFLSIAGSSI